MKHSFSKHTKLLVTIACLVVYFALLTVISYLRAPKLEDVNYLDQMSCSREAMRNEDQSITLSEGDVLFGPYLDLEKGTYLVMVENGSEQPIPITITSESGTSTLAHAFVDRNHTVFPLMLLSDQKQIEFVIKGERNEINLSAIYIEETEEVPADLTVLSSKDDNNLARIDYIDQMICSREGMRNDDGSITVTEGDVLFGPYISLTQGSYLVSFVTDSEQPFQLTVTCDAGGRILSEPALTAKEAQFTLALEQDAEQVEFVLRGIQHDITITSVSVEPAEDML